MISPRFLFPVLGVGLLLAACDGGNELTGGTYGPPGTGGFDPGKTPTAGSGAAYGSGAGGPTGTGGMMDPGPPECDDSLKRCAYEFTYADNGETSVELRGDFAADGWTNGIPLTKTGSKWSAIVNVPYSVDVQYKFI